MGPCNLKPELSSALSHHHHLHTAQRRDKTTPTACRLPGHAHCLSTWLLPRNPSKIRMASEFECQRKQWNYPPLKTCILRVPGFPRHEAQRCRKTLAASPPPSHTNPASPRKPCAARGGWRLRSVGTVSAGSFFFAVPTCRRAEYLYGHR